MCTVTILRVGNLLRLACNRDESRRRPAAWAPFVTRAGDQQVLMPQDPQGGGTWIAANAAGLVFALLNTHSTVGPATVGVRSRGLIIPSLYDCTSVDEIACRLDDIFDGGFAPCQLLVADDRVVVVASIGPRARHVGVRPIASPLLFTSSSLGDALVEGPRRVLFDQILAPTSSASDLAARQDTFHAHRWRDRPAVSVHMSRPEACTVSTTVVEVTAREVRMTYKPAHCDAGTPVGLIITRQQVEDDASDRLGYRYAAV